MRLPTIRTFIRDRDSYGNGEFGASRDGGRRTHKGIDIVAPPGSEILAVAAGKVTKIGFPYAQQPPASGFWNEADRRHFYAKQVFRYVEVTTPTGRRVRYFYVDPDVEVGYKIAVGRALGAAQSLQIAYPGITDHYHFEVKTPSGEVINPHSFLEDIL